MKEPLIMLSTPMLAIALTSGSAPAAVSSPQDWGPSNPFVSETRFRRK